MIQNLLENINEIYCMTRGCPVIIHGVCLDTWLLISIFMCSLTATLGQFSIGDR